MIRSDRRSLLKGTLALAALTAAPVALHGRTPVPALIVYDARFSVSRKVAAHWRTLGVPVLDPRDHDLGIAWRNRIPDLLTDGSGIEGATLWSDQFICERLGADHGLRLHSSEATGWLRRWRLA